MKSGMEKDWQPFSEGEVFFSPFSFGLAKEFEMENKNGNGKN